MIRGTRRPGGAGRSTGRIKGGGGSGGRGGKGGGGKSSGCILLILGSALMLASGLSLIALKLVA